MLFYFEFHSNRNIEVKIGTDKCVFMLFFVTLGGVATTIRDLEEEAAWQMAYQIKTRIIHFGEAGLEQKVEAALRIAADFVDGPQIPATRADNA